MQITPFQAIYPNLDYITSPDSFFDNVKEEYNEYYESGFFNQTKKEALFIYQISTATRKYTGLIACANINTFLQGQIKKHEATLADKEQKQIQLILKRKAAVKPVLLAYPEVPELNDFLLQYTKGKPAFLEVFFEREEATHSFWQINEAPPLKYIQQLFDQKIPSAYIADGHHRTSSVAVLYDRLQNNPHALDYSQLLAAFFPVSDLEILDFNRVVDGLSEISLTTFMAKLSQVCDIKLLDQPEKPSQKHELTLFINKEWFKLKWKPAVLEEFRELPAILDTMLLNKKILGPILDLDKASYDLKVTYVANPQGLEGVRKESLNKESNLGFCLYPVHMSELIALADSGRTLPPKST